MSTKYIVNNVTGQTINNEVIQRPYRVYTALMSQTGGDDPFTITTPEPLVIGQTYQINLYSEGDDFTNVGAPSNTVDVWFIATGTTPAVWTNGSTLFTNGGAPRMTSLENTLGTGLTLRYLDIGVYNIISDVPTFTSSDKVYVMLQFWGDDNVSPRHGITRWINDSTLDITAVNIDGVLQNGIGDFNTGAGRYLTSIEIRIYN